MKENYFKELYMNAPIAYQSLNINGMIMDVNNFWLDELGYELEEVQGKWFGDFLEEKSQLHFKKNFPKFKDAGYIKNVKFNIKAKDGSLIAVNFDGKIGYSPEGEFKRTHCVFHRAESDKKSYGNLFHQSVFEQSTIPMVIVDPETLELIDVNIAACSLYATDYKNLINKNIIELTIEKFDKIELIREQIVQGNISSFETEIVDFANNIKTIEVYPTVFVVNEKRYVTLVLVDITEEKLDAKKLQIKNSISNAFLSHDETAIYADISKILRETFDSEFCYVGYLNNDGILISPSLTVEVWDKCEIKNKTFEFPPDMWGGLWGESLKEKRSIYKNENLNSPSGHVKLKNAMAVVVCDNEKLLGQFVVANKKGGYDQSDFNIGLMIADTMRPILKFWTEDKFSKELLNEKREELRQQLLKEMELNRKQGQILFEQKKFVDMGQMMSAIAHQWRQPLNNIHLIMNSIEKLHEGEKVNFDFEELSRLHKETVEFMSNTIDSFRDYLTSDAKNASFSVTKAIADTVNLITAQFQSQNVNLSFYFQDKYMSIKSDTVNRHLDIDPLDDLIYGDIGSFHQIILNILSNARDAVLEYRADNPGEGEVNIFVVPEDDVIRITVQNIGNPIAEDVLPKIFDPYFTTKEDGKGTGVGLYMTKMFVEDGYKGKIYAANRSDGVEFVVSIPKDIKKGL